jgi:hypothetical protein
MSVMIDKLPGIDTVVAAVVNRLSGPDFARALADVQNARGDGLDLPLPSKIIDAEVDPKTFQAGDFPLAMVLGGDASTNTPRDTDASFTVAVLVVCLLNGDDTIHEGGHVRSPRACRVGLRGSYGGHTTRGIVGSGCRVRVAGSQRGR